MTGSALANWVGGLEVAPSQGEVMENLDPRDGSLVNTVPCSGPAEADAAVAAARACMEEGGGGQGGAGGLDVDGRIALLGAVADRVDSRLGEYADAEARDTGKPRDVAEKGDIPRGVENLRFFAGALGEREKLRFSNPDSSNEVLDRPLGVVALITPWNFPFHLLTWKLGPAIAMGNAVVAKPSELTPTTASMLAEDFTLAGAPDGLFNILHGRGAEAGDALVRHPDVRGVSFTGGTETGKAIAGAAAPLLKKVSLELGGKNPSVVFADCDFDSTLEGIAKAAFFNSGQVCLCGSRILVEASIHDRLVEGLVKEAGKWESRIGPLISMGHRDMVASYVEIAVKDGAKVMCGGSASGPDAGSFFPPTVLCDLDHSTPAVQEEIFGPVATVHPFKDEAEALALANDTAFGLSGSVWTSDMIRARRFAEKMETGMVWVNTWNERDLRVPFGGMKQSGSGREGGRWSMDFFSEARNLCVKG
jgi:aminomuconate-semialdehyde/2-hydroxymuconate-6-semialdehyde dehydrogenase